MEYAVSEVAGRLGVDDSRVRAMLRAGRLRGRHLGGRWLVDGDEVDRAVRERAPRGRPLAASRAWALLDLLDGGSAPWIDASGRSRLRAAARDLLGGSDNRWRALLVRRQDVFRCHAHPAAVRRLLDEPGVVPAGAGAAVAAGADLVVVEAVPEVYVEPGAWGQLSARYAVRAATSRPDVVVRVPSGIWPFVPGAEHPGPALLAADLLDSDEPRAVAAGGEVLRALAHDLATRHPGRG